MSPLLASQLGNVQQFGNVRGDALADRTPVWLARAVPSAFNSVDQGSGARPARRSRRHSGKTTDVW